MAKGDLPLERDDLTRNFFTTHHPQFCINCAAYTAVDKAESEKDLAFRINADGAGMLALLCHENNCRFIHISTDYVFDGKALVPYTEESATNPLNIYGASKLEGERRAMQLNPDSIIIRTSWLYSAFGKNFVKTMIRLMKERDEISVVKDQIGSPTYAADLAEAILQIISFRSASNLEPPDHDPSVKHPASSIQHPAPATPGIYHFSNNGKISWYDFAVAIKEFTGSTCAIRPIASAQYPTPASRPQFSVLDNTKIQRVFGIQLKDWKKSLESCIRKIQTGPNESSGA
jgi:dTDP-4-dehydrorhamnose reductase